MLLAAGSRCLTAVCLSGFFVFSLDLLSNSRTFSPPHLRAQPKKQLPADQRAFHAAQAITDPEKRLAALRQFIQQFPKSTRVDRAQSRNSRRPAEKLSRPRRRNRRPGEIARSRNPAKVKVACLRNRTSPTTSPTPAAAASISQTAEKFARDATEKLTESPYDKEMTRAYRKYKQPPPSAADLHRGFRRGPRQRALRAGRRLPARGKYSASNRRARRSLCPRPNGR